MRQGHRRIKPIFLLYGKTLDKTHPTRFKATPNESNTHPKRINRNAHAGSRTRVTSMGGLYDAATLRALVVVESNCFHYVRLIANGKLTQNAVSEDRTHDLRIMRPTRYQLRYHRLKKVHCSSMINESQERPQESNASAGNRTQVTSMATMYSATRPLMLLMRARG